MKKLFTFFLTITCIFSLSAQEIIYISFQPKAGAAPIDTTWVTNLVTNQKVKLVGGETLLLATKTVPVTSVQSNAGEAYLWPNPCNGEVSLDFSTDFTEPVTANLYSASGQLLSMVKQNLTPGWHRFNIQFPMAGMYFLSVQKNSGNLSFKAVSTGMEVQNSEITYEGEATPDANRTNGQMKNATVQKTMNFEKGERLYYSSSSGKNKTVLTDSPALTKVYTVEFVPCVDQDNQNYPVLKVGTQWWMETNLNTTKFRDGTAISFVTDNAVWDSNVFGGSYCFYNNDEKYKKTYGALYNWDAVNSVHPICPAGWHIPSQAEWTQMINLLGGESYAGGKLKETGASHWITPINETTNETGYTTLPAGIRGGYGYFYNMGYIGFMWSSTEQSATKAWALGLYNDDIDATLVPYPKQFGLSIRCVKDVVN